MRFEKRISDLQSNIYNNLNALSHKNKTLGRLISVPVAILEAGIGIAKIPLITIEFIARAVFSLIMRNSLKYTLNCLENSLFAAVALPIQIALAPVRIIYQIFAIVISPEHARPYCEK